MIAYDDVLQKVCEMICDAKDLEPDEVEENTPLVRLKLDSLDYVELMVLAKREFNITAGSGLVYSQSRDNSWRTLPAHQ